MKFKDYYKIMGVEPTADAAAVKTAYRTLARKWHPDVSKAAGTERRFTDLVEVYEVLSDPKRRAEYDELRANGFREGQEMDPPPRRREAEAESTDDHSGQPDQPDFSDFFQSMFGRGGGPAGHRGGFARGDFRGEDSHHVFPISLEEVFHGGKRTFSLQDGSGREPRTISVKIPPGSPQGTVLRLRGQGRPGSDAASAGDLYLELELSPHRWFTVAGRDVTLDLPIAPWEAVLGAQVAVPTLGGTLTVTIPADAQGGQKLRLKGRGLPGDVPGDQYLSLRITLPATCDEPSREHWRALAALAKSSAFRPRAAFGL